LDVLGRRYSALNAHPPHQRGHRQPADHDALRAQQVTQHPAAREGMLHMQRVDPVA